MISSMTGTIFRWIRVVTVLSLRYHIYDIVDAATHKRTTTQEKMFSWFMTRSDTNQSVQAQRKA